VKGTTPRVFMFDLLATVPYYTAYLSRALLKEDVDLTVGSVSYYLDSACFSGRGVAVHPGCLDVVSRFALPWIVRRPVKFLEALTNQAALALGFLFKRPDILHIQFLPMLTWVVPFDLWFVLLCRKRGIRLILTIHDLLPHDTGEAHKARFVRLYHAVDWIICHSDHVRDRLEKEFLVKSKGISVIPHGPFFYDLAPSNHRNSPNASKQEPRAIQVLWQGLIFPYKGVDLLLDAWQEVEETEGDHRLIIAGTGPVDLLRQIRHQVDSLALKNVELRLEFIPALELVQLYRESDVVVYPYRAITTSGSLATGLALGKAIIASDLPVFRELLIDHRNALLVDMGRPDALANALLELVEDGSLRESLATGVRSMNFGDHSWTAIAKKTVEAYREALSV
jgi:glycosyltransferase involved in cell wall biosynthesis